MNEIKGARYEGYLWYSDETKPRVFSGSEFAEDMVLDESANPFVVEGNLWDAESRESIFIRYIDGRYHIRHTRVTAEELRGIDDSELDMSASGPALVATTVKEYKSHRIDGVKALRFLQYWQGEEDALCEGMTALRPSKLVFVGFKK